MSIVETLLETARRDTDLLTKNSSRGDDFAKPRLVDFVLLADEDAKAFLVRDFINDNRYGEATAQVVNGQFRVLARVLMPTTQHVLCSVSGLMACVAALFGVHYDGWGCVLQTT